MDGVAHGPASIAALRDAVQKGREPPAAESVARLPSYWLFVIGTVCIGAFMGQVDSSIAQLLLPKLELEFNARLSTVSWVAVSYLLAMAAFLPIFGRLADMMGRKLLYTGGFLLFVLSRRCAALRQACRCSSPFASCKGSARRCCRRTASPSWWRPPVPRGAAARSASCRRPKPSV